MNDFLITQKPTDKKLAVASGFKKFNATVTKAF